MININNLIIEDVRVISPAENKDEITNIYIRSGKIAEPFRTEENKGYKPEYLAGFAAERYSIGLDSAWGIARKSIKSKLEKSNKTRY